MSDPRYRAGVMQGIKHAVGPGGWPDEVKGYGARLGGQPFSRCVLCPVGAHSAIAWSFVRYGGKPLCKKHAVAINGGK